MWNYEVEENEQVYVYNSFDFKHVVLEVGNGMNMLLNISNHAVKVLDTASEYQYLPIF